MTYQTEHSPPHRTTISSPVWRRIAKTVITSIGLLAIGSVPTIAADFQTLPMEPQQDWSVGASQFLASFGFVQFDTESYLTTVTPLLFNDASGLMASRINSPGGQIILTGFVPETDGISTLRLHN
jgi:hypothetical protein